MKYGANGYGEALGENDQRRDIPTYHRNIEPILEVFGQELDRSDGDFLEVGSGTGQHVSHFAGVYPELRFWPTDYIEPNLASIDAWARDQGRSNVKPARQLDVRQEDWFSNWGSDAPGKLDVIFCANVIHISPWMVAEGLLAGAGRYLKPGGKLILYGPYRVDDAHTAPSNAEFEKWLKSLDPENGIRDIGEVERTAIHNGLSLSAFHPVPANNFMPVFVKV